MTESMTNFQRELEELIKLRSNPDTEVAHVRADDLLCDILEQIGEDEIVSAYRIIRKRY